ncbi:hypothetical protein CBR_g3406 [Chara braunii]|uniref:Integrase catalytic domain-containing protein n=1 Tax=Chara braunii TaxID=69332 RepID=A0A388JQW9_CHABU|nr:hypothetical protein CBR_g3406 [Chara braunii]|eukprot:GBG60163.1 hypothetical protein CBR_g3406 [Chara braunii]
MVDTRGGKSTTPCTQAQQDQAAAIMQERREKKEKKELLKQAKSKAIAEEQVAKKKKLEEMMRLQQEEEEKKRAAEEEAAEEEEELEEEGPLERRRTRERGESSGTKGENPWVERKISEWVANLSIGRKAPAWEKVAESGGGIRTQWQKGQEGHRLSRDPRPGRNGARDAKGIRGGGRHKVGKLRVMSREDVVPAEQSVGDHARPREDVVPAEQSVGDHARPREDVVPAERSVGDHVRPREDVVPTGQSVRDHMRPGEDVVPIGQSVGDHVRPREDMVPAGQSVGDHARLREGVVPAEQSVGDRTGLDRKCGTHGTSVGDRTGLDRKCGTHGTTCGLAEGVPLTEPRRRLVACRSLVWERQFLVGPMEVNAWTAGSNGPTEMCGVIPEINGGHTSGKSGWGILGKKDIMVIVAASRSEKETRDVMMRKYLAAEKMATEVDLAAVRRKNFATYNDFLREFTLVALRIPGVMERIMREVTDLLRAKMDSFIVEPTASPYANRWFVFRKPNKTLRWIQDLQKLNAVTIRDADSLPQADLLAESYAGRSIYSLIDLYSGYDQLPLDVHDRPYTAMHTLVGQLQTQVTPMGFINAVVEVQRRMLAVAGDMFPEKCEPYIDDNSIKGAQEKDETEVRPGIRRFEWDHLQDIKDLLRRFLVYNITASGPKSIVAVPEVTILGFRCGAYDRKPDPAETDKISQWLTPLRTTTEVRAFLGVVGFWRIFIKNFAKIAEPIRAMIREEGTMDWTEEREGVVQRLKDIFTFETVALSAPCFNDEVGQPFILETDGGPLAVVGVLIQRDEGGKERPIRFESRTLNFAERRYSQFKKEVLAILHWVEDAKPIDAFLEYEGGTLAVDNERMSEGCGSGELLIQTLEKGAPAVVAELREGPVTTRGHREENDSWRAIVGPKEELIAMAVKGGREAVMSLEESWERKELQWVVNQMQEGKDGGEEGEEFFYVQSYEGLFREIGLLLVGNKQPTEVSIKAREEAERYVLRGGHLFRREEGAMPRRVVCGRSRQEDVILAMHDGLVGGHRSSKGTLAKMMPLYYWPGMAGMVAIYCQTCLICQERSSVRVFELLRPTRVLGPRHLVHLDLVVMPVSTDGYRYIMDARDNLSGFVEAVALKKKTRRSVADWIEDFYLRHPFVMRFIADNGMEFVNHEVLGMLKRLCVPIKLIEPYHPEANASVERGHRTLKNTIAKLAADHLGSWPRYLKQSAFAENMTPKRTTGYIPTELWYGREIDFPVEALVPT